jgi:Ca2+-binding EF-hand superfamily protein
MNSLAKLSLASALMLSAAFGVASAQQANEPAAPPAAQNQANDDGDGWFGWGHGKGGCNHEGRRGGGKHHGRQGADGDDEGRGGGRGEGRGGMRMMAMIDTNSDGVIGDDEAASRVEGVFLAMDNDGNGEVTLEEYMAVRMGPGEGRNKDRMAQMQEAKKQRFEAMDTDKDGKVTKVQFLDAGKARFLAADSDKDGKVSPWEFRANH